MLSVKFVILVFSASSALGMDCSFIGSEKFEDQLLHSCPRPFQDPSKSYCCPTSDGSFECCDFPQFISTPPFDMVVLLVIVVVLLIVGCVVFACCMFCCCAFCRNHSRGRVLHQPSVRGF